MHGIHGQGMIDLDPHVDVAGFNALLEECRLGLAMSQWDIGSFGPGVYEKDLTRDLFAIETGAHAVGAGQTPHPDAPYLRQVFSKMNSNQRRLYLKLRYGLYIAGNSVYLRAPTDNNYLSINRAEATQWTANASHFPGLLAWIARLPFQSVGRVMFFVSEHLCPVVEHSDGHGDPGNRAYVANRRHHNEFLWIRPKLDLAKTLYVLDEATGERHPVRGQAAWFNSFDVHGADAGDTMTWSLRVDGIFSDALRERIAADAARR